MTQHKDPPLEELGLVISKSPDPMWIYDQETLAFLDVNRAAESRYGYSHEEFLRMTILDIRPVEDVPEFLRSVLHPHKKQVLTNAPSRHRSKTGDIFLVEVTTREIVFQGRQANLVMIRERIPAKASVDW